MGPLCGAKWTQKPVIFTPIWLKSCLTDINKRLTGEGCRMPNKVKHFITCEKPGGIVRATDDRSAARGGPFSCRNRATGGKTKSKCPQFLTSSCHSERPKTMSAEVRPPC